MKFSAKEADMKNGTVKNQLDEINNASGKIALPILFAISFSHLLNDAMQSLIPAIYPNIKNAFNLDFVHIGIITLTFQLAASIFQPVIGHYTDKKPKPYSLAGGMGFTLAGLVFLSFSQSYEMILIAVGLIGIGSSVFHPEAARVAYIYGKKGNSTINISNRRQGRCCNWSTFSCSNNYRERNIEYYMVFYFSPHCNGSIN
jgi:MFS family permease